MQKTTILRIQSLLFVLLLSFSLAFPVRAEESSSGISLNFSEISLHPGESKEITAAVPSGWSNLTWVISTAEASVAVITRQERSFCTVEAVSAGTATLTASALDDYSQSHTVICKIHVTTPVTGISITTPAAQSTLNKGQTLQLSAAVVPSDATNPSIKWSSSDISVVSVNDSGVVTGVSPGRATITAASEEDSNIKDTRDVECSGIALSKSSLTLLVNETASISFPVYGAATGKAVEWNSSNNAVADVVNGRITGHLPGTAIITATVYGTGYSDSCTVVVKDDVADAIERDLDAGEVLSFSDLQSLLNSRCRDKTGATLDYITNVSVPTTQGIVYYGYVSPNAPGHGIGSSEKYYYESNSGTSKLSDLSFVPHADFNGTAKISYVGYASNGTSFNGTILVDIEDTRDVTYSTSSDWPLEFTSEAFNAICQSRTGRSIKYLTFTQPSASRGTLYYKYSPAAGFSQQVNSTTKYYTTSSPSINDITFVPAEGYTGSVSIPYTCVDSGGTSFNGKVLITVYEAGNSGNGTVTYRTGVNENISLNASDFNKVCQDVNDTNLNYIYFDDLPRSSEGTLYYNYTSKNNYDSKVSETTRYYRNSSPRLSYITFVPATGFTGTVTIPFTGRDSSGEKFPGNLVIRVTDDGRNSDVYYSTSAGRAVDFSASDFNDACKDATGENLRRVKFELPSSTQGTLYYNYTNSSSTGTKVSASTSYYRTSSPQLSNVTFVPKSGYTGTVTIPFTGYDVEDRQFSGTVRISVGPSDEVSITYKVFSSSSVDFDAADFNTACREMTDETLNYVRFSLPASKYGTLYYQYNTSTETGTKVTSSTNYYRTNATRLLSDVSFAAASDYIGTVSIDYTGRSTGGTEFSGTIDIQVLSNNPTSPVYTPVFSDVHSHDYYYDAVIWAVRNGITTGTSTFTFSPNATCTRAQAVTFIWRAAGSPAPNRGVNPFTDVKPTAYYYNAVLWAVEQGITSGTTSTTFSPDATVTRGQAVTFLHRYMGSPVPSTKISFTDVKSGEYCAPAVSWAAANGITGGTSSTTFSPDAECTRAQILTFMYRALG